MNLSKNTLTIIKNFATINGSIMLKEGNKLATISEGKNVIAEAVVEDTYREKELVEDIEAIHSKAEKRKEK